MMRRAEVSGKAPRRPATTRLSGAARPEVRASGRSGPDLAHERKLWRAGHELVAGMDEVGRGAWAGPLTVGVAVMTRGVRRVPTGLRDSKQLAEPVREALYAPVGKWCAAWAVGHTTPQECDALGMTRALRLAARRAFGALPPEAYPNAVVLDGSFDFLSPKGVKAESPDESEPYQTELISDDPRITEPVHVLSDEYDMYGQKYGDLLDVTTPDGNRPEVKTVVKGDDKCASVAAASVLAKVTRDRMMREDAACYPGFDFDHNKGYPAPSHKIALRGYGLTAIHRRTWAFVDWLPWERSAAPGREWRDDDLSEGDPVEADFGEDEFGEDDFGEDYR
jgi:ribonuclease HII